MGLFDFFKSGRTNANAISPSMPPELTFRSGKDALDYIQAFMRTEWKAKSLVVGLLGQASLHRGVLSAVVLIPKGDGFLELPTTTPIKVVGSPKAGRMPLNNSSDITQLNLSFGDLVSVLLSGQNTDLCKIYPETQGWIGFVVAKNSLTYSFKHDGWILENKYEL
jgi:hypothetical protein